MIRRPLSKSTIYASLLVAAVTVLGNACMTSGTSGDLRVYWGTTPGACTDDGIVDVRIRVLSGSRDIVKIPAIAPCAQGPEGFLLESVPTGRYTVLVEGRDQDGVPAFEGRVEGVVVQGGDETAVGPIALGLKRASIRLRWGFERLFVCGSVGILEVRALVFDEIGNEVVPPVDYPCDPPVTSANPGGGVLLDNLPARRTLSVLLYGMDALGSPVRFGYGEVETSPGDIRVLDIILEPCDPAVPCLP